MCMYVLCGLQVSPNLAFGFPGGIWIFAFRDLAKFWFRFSIFAIKKCGFLVLVSCSVCWSCPIQSLGFSFCQQCWWFFRFFCLVYFVVFLAQPRELHPKVVLKLIPRGRLQGSLTVTECMTSLTPLTAIIWVVTDAKQTMKSLK